MVQAKFCYVEDRVTVDVCVIKMLRSLYVYVLIIYLDVSKVEVLSGVVYVIIYLNCSDIYYISGGQSVSESLSFDRRMFGKKMRYVGDRVVAVVVESEEIAFEVLKFIDVEYEVFKSVMSIDEVMAEDAFVVYDESVVYVVGALDILEDDNSYVVQRGEYMIINFSIGFRFRKNIVVSIYGYIGDMDKGFVDVDVIIERIYNLT